MVTPSHRVKPLPRARSPFPAVNAYLKIVVGLLSYFHHYPAPLNQLHVS